MLRALVVSSRAICRIVRGIIYWFILWHQYNCTLYISTRNAILWSHDIAFRRTLPVHFAGSVASRNLLFSELHLLSSPTVHWMFHSLAPLPLFLFLPSKLLLSLSVCECCFVWLRRTDWFVVESINTHDESMIEFSGAAVMPVLFSTFGAHGAVKDHFFWVYSTPVLLLIYPPLRCDTALYGTVSITLYSTMTTCVQVPAIVWLLSTNNYDMVLLFTHLWLQYTGAVLLHDMYWTLALYHCMTCTVHKQAGAVLVVTFIVAHAQSYIPPFSLTSSLCCAFLIRRHATSGVMFLICCFWME